MEISSGISYMTQNINIEIIAFFTCTISNLILLIIALIFLFKGNKLAWQNRRFESIEQFKIIQKKWLFWGVITTALKLLLLAINFYLTFKYDLF